MNWDSLIVDDASRFAARSCVIKAADFMGASLPTADAPVGMFAAEKALEHEGVNSIPDSYQQACELACDSGQRALSLLARLDARHKEISSRTSALHASCKSLAEAADTKRETAKRIAQPLAAFDSFYVIGTRLHYKFEPRDAVEAVAATTAAAQIAKAGGTNLHKVRIPVDLSMLMSLDPASPIISLFVNSSEALSPTTSPEEFAAALDRLDECISIIASHSQFKETTAFIPKLRSLQLHALQIVRDTVFAATLAACNAAAESLRRETAGQAELPELSEVSSIHLQFRATMAHIRKLLTLIEARASRRAYSELLRDCYSHYVLHRGRLVQSMISLKFLHVFTKNTPQNSPAQPIATEEIHQKTLSQVRSAAAILARALLSEASLFSALFIASEDRSYSMATHVRNAADHALSDLHDEVCASFIDNVRATALVCDSLDTLCELVSVLRDEVIAEIATPRGPALAALARCANIAVKDIQERLVFLANVFISERLALTVQEYRYLTFPLSVPLRSADRSAAITAIHLPSSTLKDIKLAALDYPAWLLAYYLRVRSASAPDQPSKPPSVYDAWFPVLEVTLGLLAKLYRALEQPSFDALAQDAVAACTAILLQARTDMSKALSYDLEAKLTIAGDWAHFSAVERQRVLQTGIFAGCAVLPCGVPMTALLDGDLFLIKNLLILREQLSPFEVQLTSTTKSLDFSSTTEALSTLLSRAGELFTGHAQNMLLSFVMSGLPKVSERKVDCKQELENLLRISCEQLIVHCIDAILGPASSQPKDTDAGAILSWLSASLEKVQNVIPPLRRRIGFYLESSVTAAILFKPIRDRVLSRTEALVAHLPPEHREAGSTLQTSIREVLLASDQLVLDPSNISYGFDHFESPLMGSAAP